MDYLNVSVSTIRENCDDSITKETLSWLLGLYWIYCAVGFILSKFTKVF